MCDHCGCRGVGAIRELMDEHTSLVDDGDHIRRALRNGDAGLATEPLTDLLAHLERHVRREETGIFEALRASGEFLDEVGELEGEHRDLAARIASLDIDSADFGPQVNRFLDELEVHVAREDYGIFPAAVVTLGAPGWQVVDTAHAESPSFLTDPTS